MEIYERRLKGETTSSIAKSLNVRKSAIKYLISLIKKHGYDILRNGKNRIYSKDFKLQTINRILINHKSINYVAIDIGLVSSVILHNWLSKFKEMNMML
ncbi:transposase [Fusobacterium nucleatum subsp. nucleatum ChDC F316]|nr:transposase [Fusobacterium nucleatum subsp. nucleatum ChDC F316]